MMKKALPTEQVAQASKIFEQFYSATEFQDILYYHHELCNVLTICPGPLPTFYNVIKANVRSNAAVNLFQVLDKKIQSNCYESQEVCAGMEVGIVGGGPCGLRYAIESQLLGAHATVLEKRSSFTRNNVLHLWPFVIEDLKMLGTKQFYPKFCTGSMNHISIRRLQTILLKVALVLGAQIYGGIGFVNLQEPDDDHDSSGWRIETDHPDHPVNLLNIDVLIGAEGKRVTVPGFKRKEFRGKLAIAITANFKNNRTTAEAVVEEISGVAFVYKQDFFNNLYEELGIALENIVYYKDETHYFVMTTKKHSLLDRGVLKKDLKDPIALLNAKNVNKTALLDYIKDACDYCTDYQLPNLEFELNHHNEPDVALFDFTSMFAASNSCYVKERHGKQVLLGLVGDGLLEPFWPTGSGCARGFLGVLDTCFAMQEWSEGHKSVLQILAERESIFRLLPQTTSENLSKEFKNYAPSPTTRYPTFNKYLYSTHQMQNLYISDNPGHADLPRNKYIKMRKITTTSANNAGATRFKLQQQMQQQKNIRAPVKQYSDDDEEEDERICEIDKRIELRKKMLAEEKAQNDPSQYFTNRAKMMKEKNDSTTSKSSSEKTDRLQAMAKISDTFGYGEVKVNKGRGDVKKDQVGQKAKKPLLVPTPTEPRPKTKKIQAAKEIQLQKKIQATKEIQQKKKSKSAAVGGGGGGVKPWDFGSTSGGSASLLGSGKKSSSTSGSGVNVDPELDLMLAKLEVDTDFKEMSENDQIAWLESLFFLDTPSKQASSGLVKSRPRVLESGESRRPSTLPSTKVDTSSSAAVSSKSLSIQSNSGNRAASKSSHQQEEQQPKGRENSNNNTSKQNAAAESSDELDDSCSGPSGGLNKDKCALAMSFFANDSSSSSKKAGKTPSKKLNSTKKNSIDNSSIGSTSDISLPSVQNASARPYNPVPERAYFEPEGLELPEDDEEDSMEVFQSRAKSRRQQQKQAENTNQEIEIEAPPVPTRSGEPKQMMLRLMKNATSIMRS